MTSRITLTALLLGLTAGLALAVEENTDRPGMVFSSFGLQSSNPAACEAACQADVRCQSWTYIHPNPRLGPQSGCELKGGVPAAISSPCCVSGVKEKVPASSASPLARPSVDLSGRWKGSDDGTYYMRQEGDSLRWYGQGGSPAAPWSNVYQGRFDGNRVLGHWSGPPLTTGQAGGSLILSVEGPDRLVMVEQTGGYGGSVWLRQAGSAAAVPQSSAPLPVTLPASPVPPGQPGVSVAPQPPLPSQQPVVLETLTIPNDRPVKVQSRTVLQMGRSYWLEANGVVSDWDASGRDGGGVDAVWCYAPSRCGSGQMWNQLRIDDQGMSDLAGAVLAYNPQHQYRVRILGQGRPITVYALDAQGSAGDNWGSFTLKIFDEAMPAGMMANPPPNPVPAAPPAAAPGSLVLETLTIPNDRPVKVQSRTVLQMGRSYWLEANGVVSDWDASGRDGGGVDAVWCYAPSRCGSGQVWNQLRIDDQGMSDLAGAVLAYNPQHQYRVRILGQGRPITVYALDAQGSAGDNWGSFTLKIFDEAMPAGMMANPPPNPVPAAPPAAPPGSHDELRKAIKDIFGR